MRKLLFLFITLLSCWLVHGQTKTPAVKFVASVNGSNIQMNTWMSLANGKDSIYLTKLKYYLTDLQLTDKGQKIRQSIPDVLLLDFDSSLPLLPDVSDAFDQLSFKLGIDSAIQSSGALEGELDPLKGMYWTWQSGYIHFKLEGMIHEADGKTKNIILHLGGYRSPNNSVKKVDLLSQHLHRHFSLELDLSDLIQQIISNNIFHIMSPGKEAVELSELISQSFKIHNG